MTTRPAPAPDSGFPFTWHAKAARWRDRRTGRFVPALAPRQALEGVITATQDEMLILAARLQAHAIPLAEWQLSMAGEIKRLHLVALLAAGGDPTPGGRLEAILRLQWAALDGFALALAQGTAPLDGRLLNRVRLYAQAGRATWEAVRMDAEAAAGKREYISLLHAADHCRQCLDVAQQGWQPIGTLPPIGSRECGTHDKCSWSYR